MLKDSSFQPYKTIPTPRGLDLGADKRFKHAADHVICLVQTIAGTKPTADVLYATTRSLARMAGFLDDPIGLLHVMGHRDLVESCTPVIAFSEGPGCTPWTSHGG